MIQIGRRRPVPGDRNLWLDPAARRARRTAPAGDEPKRKLTRRARILLAVLGLAFAGGGAAWLEASGLLSRGHARLEEALALETVSVEGNLRTSPDELLAASGLVAGTPLPDIDVQDVRLRVEAHPWVRRASVVRVPPALVIVRVEERTPAAVTASAGGAPWLVDAMGIPFAPAAPDDVTSLPWISSPGPVLQGEATGELVRAAALAVALRDTSFADGAEIRVAPDSDPEGLSLLVAGLRGRVVLGLGDLADKLRRLEVLRRERVALPETAQVDVIDLRFADRAVLRSAAPDETARNILGTPEGGASPPPGRRL